MARTKTSRQVAAEAVAQSIRERQQELEEEIAAVEQELRGIDYTERTFQERMIRYRKEIQQFLRWRSELKKAMATAPDRRVQLERRLQELQAKRTQPAYNAKAAKAERLVTRIRELGLSREDLEKAGLDA